MNDLQEADLQEAVEGADVQEQGRYGTASWRNGWMLVLLVLLVAGPLWLWTTRVPVDAQAERVHTGPAVGSTAPDFTLRTLDGETFALHELRGTPVVLNFWATWCGPCQREMPELQAAAERFDGQVVIAGIDQGEEAQTVANYVSQLGVTFPIPMDQDFVVGEQYNVTGMPTTFFVDGQGTIRHMWVGEMNAVTLAEGIAQIWP